MGPLGDHDPGGGDDTSSLMPIARHSMWEEVGRMVRIPFSSTVLQRRRGYRRVLQHFSRIRLAPMIPLDKDRWRDLRMGSGRAPGVQPALLQVTGTKALLLRAADSRHRSPGHGRAERRPPPVRREVPGSRGSPMWDSPRATRTAMAAEWRLLVTVCCGRHWGGYWRDRTESRVRRWRGALRVRCV